MTPNPVPFSASDISEMRFVPSTIVTWRDVMRGHNVKSISLALGIHILAIIVVIVSATFSASQRPPLSSTKTTPPVRAVLYFPPSIIAPSTEAETVTPSNDAPLQTKEKKVTVEDVQVTNETATEPDNQIQSTSHALVDAEKVSNKANKQTPRGPVALPSLNALKAPESRTSNQPITTSSAVADYFNNYNETQLQDVAQQASNTFQERKTSPVLIDPTYQHDTDADEQRIAKKVDCTNGAAKVLSLLSGLTGGTLKCTEFGGADKFIEKRIKKAPETDRQQR